MIPYATFYKQPQTFSVQFSCSVVSNSATPWTAARQASLSITNSWSLHKLMSIKSVMPSNHLILCHPLLLLPSTKLLTWGRSTSWGRSIFPITMSTQRKQYINLIFYKYYLSIKKLSQNCFEIGQANPIHTHTHTHEHAHAHTHRIK